MKAFIVLFLSIATATLGTAGDTNSHKVDLLFAAFDKPGSPGCSVGAIRNGSFIYKKSFGYASLEFGVPLRSDSVVYVGSVSKQFTAASVVLAAEQGYLSLDDDVHKYLPELADYGHPVTLRQMLHQTSGFRDLFDLIYLSGRDTANISSAKDILKLIARQKGLNNVPGAEWLYSNSNYFLLAEVVQRATKKSLAQFATENIFQPLGMKHTLFYDDHTLVVPNRVAAYDRGKDGRFLVDWSTTYDLVGGGGLMSTVDDLMLWDRNFYSNKLGKGGLVKELQTPGVLNDGNKTSYAMGLSLGEYRGLPIVEHNGALLGYRSEFLRFPKQEFSVILLCNLSTSGPEGLAHQIADIYLQEDFQSPAKANPSPGLPDPAQFAGTYLDPRTKTTFRFSAEHGNLVAWGAVLQRIDANKFYDLSSDIITFENNNGTMHASLRIPGELYFSGDKLQPPPVVNEKELAKFVGDFHSEELDSTYNLSIENGMLTIKIPNQTPAPLIPVGRDDLYFSELGVIDFHLDANHLVSGFSLTRQSSRGINFTRGSF